jgi:hypothetical protein
VKDLQELTARRAGREILACALALSLVAVVMCAGHILAGGFYYDDWGVLALGRFPPAGGVLHSLWLAYGQRPGQVLYYAALDQLLGAHGAERLALAAGMVVVQATCLFALLRRLSIGVRDAAAIAVLTLTFPFSDSVWLWGILSLASLAVILALLGVLLALGAFVARGARALALHVASISLYVASVLSYEVFAVLGLLAGLLYIRVVGWRRARARWALDVAAIALTLVVARMALPIDIATPSRIQSLAGMAAHAVAISAAGVRLAGVAALPIAGMSPWVGVGLLAIVLACAVAMRRHASSETERAEVGRLLALAGAGALVALAAWGVYVPASDHYSPDALGTVNRVNIAAAVGVVTLLYSCLALAVRMLARLARLPVGAVALATAAMTLALGVLYLQRTAGDAQAWDAAARDQRGLLAELRDVLPRPPARAVIYVFGAPRVVGPGIPVLDTKLDLTSAIRIAYSSPRLLGVPIAGASSLSCGARGALAEGVSGAYRDAYLINAKARRAVALASHRQCLALAKTPTVRERGRRSPRSARSRLVTLRRSSPNRRA